MKTTSRLLVLIWLSVVFGLVNKSAPGQDKKKPDKKVQPRVTVAIPLGVSPGAMTKVTIRGLKLDQASALRFSNSKVFAKILSKGTAPVPDKNPDQVGDTQVVVEVNVPKEMPGETLPFVVITPEGETKTHSLLVESVLPVIQAKEPNEGFAQAQPIAIPQVIDGLIDRPRDVDVFRLEGKAGDKIVCEVFAARYGSPLDSILTLYDSAGQAIASNDDSKDTVDSRLEVTLPKTGRYFLSLIDAHDQGGPVHVYRLVVRPGPAEKSGR